MVYNIDGIPITKVVHGRQLFFQERETDPDLVGLVKRNDIFFSNN
jgi:hypothetical protein